MYKIAKIKIESTNINKEEELDDIEWLFAMYYRNGQVLENYLIEDYIDHYIVTITITDDDALDSKYNNKYVNDQLKKVKISNIQITVNDALTTDSCHCTDYDRFYLVPSIDISSPIYCSKCEKEIPLYKLPHYHNDEYTPILDFIKMYHSLSNLYIYGLKDSYTVNEIMNPKSTFNKLGLKICKTYSKILKKDVLLKINNLHYETLQDSESFIELERCPRCKNDLEEHQNSFLYQKECKKCKIVYED